MWRKAIGGWANAGCLFQSSHTTPRLGKKSRYRYRRTTTTHASEPSTAYFGANAEPVVDWASRECTDRRRSRCSFQNIREWTYDDSDGLHGAMFCSCHDTFVWMPWFSSGELLIPHTGHPAAWTCPPRSCSILDSIVSSLPS